MRIISGKYKGRIIRPPKNLRARPTTDFARESLFNVLNNEFELQGLKVLDLFAGTGSVGIEFVSRGAGHVELVEKNYIHSEFIKKAIRELGINNARVVKTDVFLYIKRVNLKFDIIFADPPYDMENFAATAGKVLESDLLVPGGWFILEHNASHDFSNLPQFIRHRNYGSVNFSFFENNSA